MKTTTSKPCYAAYDNAITVLNKLLTDDFDYADADELIGWVVDPDHKAVDAAYAAMEIVLSNPDVAEDITEYDITSLVYDYVDRKLGSTSLRSMTLLYSLLKGRILSLDVAWRDLTVRAGLSLTGGRQTTTAP